MVCITVFFGLTIIGLLVYIIWLLSLRPDEADLVTASFTQIRVNGFLFIGEFKMAEIPEGKRLRAKINFKTKAGNPAKYELGTETVESSDPAFVASLDPADPTQVIVDGVDGSNNAPGLITFRADGDPDADQVRPVIATLDVICTQGEAITASMEQVGELEDTPAE